MAFINKGYDPSPLIPTPETLLFQRLILDPPGQLRRLFGAINLLLAVTASNSFADQTNAPVPPSATLQEEAISRETLSAILRIEDQLRSNQLATEQNSREAKEAAGRNSEVLARGLQSIEEAFAAQQGTLSERNLRELQAMQSFNRVMLVVGGTFTTLASLAILMVVYFQWRTCKVWAGISAGRTGANSLRSASTARAVEPCDLHAVDARAVADSNAHLLKAVGRLETRVQELEQSTGLPPRYHDGTDSLPENGESSAAQSNGGNGLDQSEANGKASVAVLLDQGRTRFQANDWEGALKCFDEVLALTPNHSEVLVKKGVALEGLKKLDEAFMCYDRAIAADDSMTIAYLHKGGLCSRLERFKEALECYEKALRTHTEWGGSH